MAASKKASQALASIRSVASAARTTANNNRLLTGALFAGSVALVGMATWAARRARPKALPVTDAETHVFAPAGRVKQDERSQQADPQH